MFNSDHGLFTYNEKYSHKSGMYFAGEGYSVEGGWLEPAFRTALDAVLRVIENTNGKFNNNFDLQQHYPKSPAWNFG